MCLKQSISHSKWVLQTNLSLTVLSNCVSGSSKYDNAFLPDCTNICSFFFRILDRKFNEDSENVRKTVIFSRQVGFTGEFVTNCAFKLCFWQFKL